jgi:hypothetical protein
MKNIYREPVTEEGKHAIILQNRCGNRLTLMVHEDRSELEFVYKPNAARRKDFRARNFSNRDNQTELFPAFTIPDLRAGYVTEFDYDPFVTRVRLQAPSMAVNTLTMVNILGENVFALSASQPLTLCFRPRRTFQCQDGLLTEASSDRGEDFISFLAFDGYEHNRYRVLDDGTHILQLYQNDILLVGGEENSSRVHAALHKLRGKSLPELIAANEAALEPVMRKGRIQFADADFQRVIDFNKRIIYSGVDEGGACFGAINRIYYLIWNRDGSQTSSMTARAGNPELLKAWAPFILANPAIRRDSDGRPVAEWLQMLGTRWTKAEDDGIYYAFLSLFTLLQTTGDDSLLDTADFDRLLGSLDHTIATRFDEKEGLFGSDVRGESDLRTSPNYGYDAVNGSMLHGADNIYDSLPAFARSYGLYHNVNLYNALRMAAVLIEAVPHRATPERAAGYLALAERIGHTVRTKYVNNDGIFHADYERMVDGTMRWIEFTDTDYTPDYWEYAWAVSVGPFFPDVGTALRSAAHVRETWPVVTKGGYGYCPWNTLSRFLKEYGVLDSASYKEMLADEVREARLPGGKFPMKDALTEYHGWTDSWRPLPFSAGSFLWSTTSLILQSLPRGLAVRASDLVGEARDFHYQTARLDATATGTGDHVATWSINGIEVTGSLQIPENLLRAGRNAVQVTRGSASTATRLYASDARLLAVEKTAAGLRYVIGASGPVELIFENWNSGEGIEIVRDGAAVTLTTEALPGGRFTLVRG